MFKIPRDRNPMLHIMERIAGMGWLLATDSIHIYRLEYELRKQNWRADTKFDSAEFEFLRPKDDECFGTIASSNLQWTAADVKQDNDAIELDSMRCYAMMNALERYVMSVPDWRPDIHINIVWSSRSGYTIMILSHILEERDLHWIYELAPNFEVTTMSRAHR